MDAMANAIKSRRGGLLSDAPVEQAPVGPQQDKNMNLMGLVKALSEDQKQMLLQMLVGENEDAKGIEKGEMGPGEKMELEEEVMIPEGPEQESEDEIMESMVSSADKMRVGNGAKPRNLGERVKMDLATKLNKKGKKEY